MMNELRGVTFLFMNYVLSLIDKIAANNYFILIKELNGCGTQGDLERESVATDLLTGSSVCLNVRLPSGLTYCKEVKPRLTLIAAAIA